MGRVSAADIRAFRQELAEVRAIVEAKTGAGWHPTTYEIVEFDWQDHHLLEDTEIIRLPNGTLLFEVMPIPSGVFSERRMVTEKYQFKECPEEDPDATLDPEKWCWFTFGPSLPESVRRATEARERAATAPVSQMHDDVKQAKEKKAAQTASDAAAIASIEEYRAKFREENKERIEQEEAERDAARMQQAMKEAHNPREYKPIVITPALPGAGLAEVPKVLEQPHVVEDAAVEMAVPVPTPESEAETETPKATPALAPKPVATVLASALPERPAKKQPKVTLPGGLQVVLPIAR